MITRISNKKNILKDYYTKEKVTKNDEKPSYKNRKYSVSGFWL
jgi:hypothetical protein